jgi:hypothetical protein
VKNFATAIFLTNNNKRESASSESNNFCFGGGCVQNPGFGKTSRVR